VSKIIEKSLSQAQLQQIYAEVESRFEQKYSTRIAELERKVERLQEEADDWKKRYFNEQKRAEGLQGKLELANLKIKELEALVERQRVQIERLQQQIYGKKPETLPPLPAPANEPKRNRGKQPGTKGKGRRPRSELDPIDCAHDFSPEERLCAICGAPYADLSEKISEEIDVEYKLIRLVHRRKTIRRTCRCPQSPRMKTAPAPPKLFKKSLFSVNVWATVMYEKYHLQRPLNRVRQWFESLGLKDVSQGTLTNGLKRLYDNAVFTPLYEEIRQRVSAAKHQQKDETGWKIFQELEGKTGYAWYLMVTLGNNCSFFEIEPTRSRDIASHTIGQEPVVLSSDCLSIYHNMGDNVTNAWCWAHIRRGLLELKRIKGYGAISTSWVKKVNTLYHFNNLRLAARSREDFDKYNQQLVRALADFERQAKCNATRTGMNQDASKIFRSIAKHWKGLTVFVSLPAIPMDNNLSEQALRNSVVGRKTYYGSGSQWSGRFAAQLFTIFATLQQNGIEPRQWLVAYLDAVARNGGKAPTNAVSFLPWNSPDSALLL
jgi:transposase